MWIMRIFSLLLGAILIVGCSRLGDSPAQSESPDIDATVQALVAEALPTETAIPTPDIAATVQALVAEALPTETAVPTPNIAATVQALVAEALPTETAVPTPAPSPTATSMQMDSSRTDATREDEARVMVEATAISDDSMMMVGDMVAKDDRFGGTLRVVAQASTESLDTSFSGAYVITVVSGHIWERLFERDADFSPQPQMVSSWEADDAGTTYTFTLRDGLKFHDGGSVTSDDVIPSLWRMWQTTASRRVPPIAAGRLCRASRGQRGRPRKAR